MEKQENKEPSRELPAPGTMNGPFTMSFSWRLQLTAALFVLGRQGDAGVATLLHLWGRPWTVDDPAYGWGKSEWYQFAVRVVALSATAAGPRPGNLPIEPTSIADALSAAFGPSPPGATFHLPQRSHRLSVPVSGCHSG